MCCQGKEGCALETGSEVEKILVLLFSSFPARSKRLQLLLALVQSFIDVGFDLVRLAAEFHVFGVQIIHLGIPSLPSPSRYSEAVLEVTQRQRGLSGAWPKVPCS